MDNTMRIVTLKDTISFDELKVMSEKSFGTMVKAIIDTECEVVAVDAGMHVDLEYFLLENGSVQDNLWGINFYPFKDYDQEWLDFDSILNIRPETGNRSRYVESALIRKKIVDIVTQLVQK